jgi:hypothetical protein
VQQIKTLAVVFLKNLIQAHEECYKLTFFFYIFRTLRLESVRIIRIGFWG